MGARKLRLKNRENPKIVFSARVSSLPLSVKHWFFFYIQAIFHIRSSMLQRRINSVKLRILTGNDFKCHRNKIAWFGSLCNSIIRKLEIFNCTRTQRIKRSSIDPTIITRKVAHFEGRIVQRQLENNIFVIAFICYSIERLWWWNIIHFVTDLFR